MLDAAEVYDLYHEGDDSGGNPEGGPFGLPDPEIKNDPANPPRMCQPFDVLALAQNTLFVCRADSRPDYWLIANSETASTEVAVYQGASDGGLPMCRLGVSGRARLPGNAYDFSLTIKGAKAAAANVSVIAVRGYDVELVRAG